MYICIIYICNHENNVLSWLSPHGFVATPAPGHTMYGSSCAQVYELSQSHCGDNQVGGHIVFMTAYILCPSCFYEI